MRVVLFFSLSSSCLGAALTYLTRCSLCCVWSLGIIDIGGCAGKPGRWSSVGGPVSRSPDSLFQFGGAEWRGGLRYVRGSLPIYSNGILLRVLFLQGLCFPSV
uniref:Secreted protein n=1 Tax=Picea glauca TaxID=3330 RepID=A0A101M082_PICGL|nr:hypothetical protein ABT39_MTgene4582 [Picea glauca]QHR88165.1 hypothetical protein Q903MT_gene2178 [Picea sitchensis]